MGNFRINVADHYRRLLFFALHRHEDDNYRLMQEYFAQILIMEIEEFLPLWNRKVLDVGGSRGVFCETLSEKRACDATNLDPDPGQRPWPKTIIGFADSLPFGDNEFDLVVCRGVLEHISKDKQQQSVNEMHRVTKAGGICYVVIPPWYNPHAGHRLKPFHVFPFRIARYLRRLTFGNALDERSFEEAGLYPVTYRRMSKMISASDFRMIAARDTHLRLHFLTRIPLVREVAIPAVAFILKKANGKVSRRVECSRYHKC